MEIYVSVRGLLGSRRFVLALPALQYPPPYSTEDPPSPRSTVAQPWTHRVEASAVRCLERSLFRFDVAFGQLRLCASGSSLKLPAHVGNWDSRGRSPITRKDAAWSGRSDTPSTAARNYRPVLADPLTHPPQLHRTPPDFPIEMM